MSAETEQTCRTDGDHTGALFHGISEPAQSHAEQIMFTLDNPLEIDAFRVAWQQLAERHAILRTGFPAEPARAPEQFTAAHCEIPVEFLDWTGEPGDAAREQKLRAFLHAQREKPFDVTKPPLFRVALIQWNDQATRVVWTLRRALLDWRSMSTLLRELFSNYHASSQGRGKGTAALVSGYPGWPDRYATATDTAFWSEYLSGHRGPSTPDLPFAPEAAGTGADGVVCRLDAAQSDAVRRLRSAADVTLNNLAQAAWALLLSHYARTDDVVFGIQRSCRRSGPPGLEDAVGSFVNVIPLRVRLHEENNVFELLWQLRDQHRQVREHECSSLAEVESCVDLADGMPLFDSVLEFDLRDPMAALEEQLGEDCAHDFRHYTGPLAGLHLQVYGEDEIVLRLKYQPGVMDTGSAERMLGQYANLLLGMAREPWMRVKDVPYLTEEEREPCRWPGTQRQQSPGKAPTLHGRFEDQARATPDATAVSCGDERVTYSQLNAAANRLARRLLHDGAKPDTLVGLCVDRSIDQIVGILGILKAGAGYLPLDPAYPEERLDFMLQDAGVKLVVASDAARIALPEDGLTYIEPHAEPGGDGDDADPAVANDPEHLAYVIYTSGSTGQPKGVMITHHNVVRLFDACESWLSAGVGDVWTLFHSFAFDFSVWEIWGALLHGGRLEVVPRDVARSPEAFYALLAERGVTVLNQTPSAFRQLMQVDAQRQHPLPALRLVVFGGEKLDFDSLAGWIDRHGDESPQLVNMYGITETTVHVTYRSILRSDVDSPRGSLIGFPLADLYVRLLDAHGRPVPPGVRGEICVGGGGVARGYLNRPQLTAARFVPDSSSRAADARLYRSGDFARQMPNGELCYLGREDDQVKIRGFRIDLGEVTAAIRAIDGIEDAIVVPRKSVNGSGSGDLRLFGYYVASDRRDQTEATLRKQLASVLPEHMLPAQLIRLATIPVNANNKVDFKALPNPSEIESEAVPASETPETPTEELLAGLWQEVLERRDIGRNEDFFGLGGDSILALQLVGRARAEGLDITPRDIFTHPVLADLARIARPISTDASDEEAHVNKDGPWALAPIQRWFFDQAFEKPDHWNEGFLFRIPPDTDVDLLERAVHEVVRHHDALHVRFTRDDHGRWTARLVSPEEAVEFSRIELDHLDEGERREAVTLITDDIQGSLSISSGLLVRAAHFTGGLEDGARLLVVVHQLAIDAASWSIILQDLDTVYRALAAGKEPVLPASTCSYARWAAQLERQASSTAIASEHAYWERIMQAGSDSPLPDAVLDPGKEAEARTHKVVLEAPDTAALLGDIHHAYGTEIHELLIAALSRACSEQWPQHKYLRLDLQRHGRDDEFGRLDVSRTVGWFTTLHPLALDQSMARNPARLICDVKTRLRSAPHRGVGWGLLRYLRPSGSAGFGKSARQRAPILFNYLGHFERVLDNGMFQHAWEDAGSVRADENRLTHPLAVTTSVHDDRMEFEFRFSPDAVPETDVESLAGKFVRAVQQLIRHCRTRDSIARTPVDFPLARITQEELDDFPVELENAEDILPLSPIQRLYHALFGTDKDVGFDQWVFHLQGRIDEAAFEGGWRELFRRHDALRTIFVDKGLSEPHQVVLRNVEFRMQRTDWRLLDETAQRQRLDEFLAADRRQGFEAHVAPLMRVTLIRAADDRWILVWSHHQALVDGWSWPVMAQELGELHDAALNDRRPELDEPGSYRSYIAWWMDRDRSDYARFWREHLGTGQSVRSLITRSRRKDDGYSGPRDLHRQEICLPEGLSSDVALLARQLRLTPSVVFQAAWALLLSALSKRFDVTLGVAFSGRTSGVPVPEHTVGPFLNDLPVRVRVNPTERVDHWLGNLRRMQADLNHYQNVSPLEVHQWAGSPASARLFDALIVFQNYATGEATRRWGNSIRVSDFAAGVRTNYPLTIAVTPGPRYRVEFFHDEKAIDAAAVGALANDLVAVLRGITQTPDVHVATILNHVFSASDHSGMPGPAERTPEGQEASRMRRATDRSRGMEPVVTGDESPDQLETPANDLQVRIATICRDVLGIGDFGIEQNFFDVGAQSVSLIEIHERLQASLKRTFPIVKLFQHPTIAALSRYLAAGESTDRLLDAGRRGAEHRAALQQRRRQSRQRGRLDRQS